MSIFLGEEHHLPSYEESLSFLLFIKVSGELLFSPKKKDPKRIMYFTRREKCIQKGPKCCILFTANTLQNQLKMER